MKEMTLTRMIQKNVNKAVNAAPENADMQEKKSAYYSIDFVRFSVFYFGFLWDI
jgi:hypothetical protein